MKATKLHLYPAVTKIGIYCFLFIVISCAPKERPVENGEMSQVSGAKVSPPSVDIHTAVVTGNMEALQQHIEAGSNLNERDPFGGSSPLISACVFDKPEMAEVLIEAGVDLNFQNNDGSTALHTAAFFCRPEIVKMLLAKGVDKTLKNRYGATPYQTVAIPFNEAKNGYDMIGKMLEPMGLKLDYAYIQKTRPEIATMLK